MYMCMYPISAVSCRDEEKVPAALELWLQLSDLGAGDWLSPLTEQQVF